MEHFRSVPASTEAVAMRKRRIVKVVAERLESFIQSNFETQAQFLDAADIGRTTLHRMLTGE